MKIGILGSGLMGGKLGTLRIPDVLKRAGDLSGKVIVSCSLPMNADDTALVIGHATSGAEQLAKKIRRAKVVSAFGTVPSEVFLAVFEARRKAKRPSPRPRRRPARFPRELPAGVCHCARPAIPSGHQETAWSLHRA
jgi:hypothetical protein